jgi:hypothetical protein
MTKRTLLLALGALVLAAQPAAATPPVPVTIVALVDFSGPLPLGTFTATSPLCPSGTFVTELVASGGGPNAFAFTGRNTFVCDDASGTFAIQFHPQGNPTRPLPSGPWAGIGGTGRYAGFHGSGDFAGFPLSPTSSVGIFTGHVHFDGAG